MAGTGKQPSQGGNKKARKISSKREAKASFTSTLKAKASKSVSGDKPQLVARKRAFVPQGRPNKFMWVMNEEETAAYREHLDSVGL